MSPSILLVEDVEDNRELARLLLETEGFDVVEAHTGAEAVEQALSCHPSLILMDLSLPGMDGWEAARRIRESGKLDGVPIVAVTAHAMSGDRERVMTAGFQGYIAKPIEVGTFVEQVRRFLPSDVT